MRCENRRPRKRVGPAGRTIPRHAGRTDGRAAIGAASDRARDFAGCIRTISRQQRRDSMEKANDQLSSGTNSIVILQVPRRLDNRLEGLPDNSPRAIELHNLRKLAVHEILDGSPDWEV